MFLFTLYDFFTAAPAIVAVGVIMASFLSFDASMLPEEEVDAILATYLALERLRVFRQLLVTRFGALALVALIAGLVIHGLSAYARWIPVGLCVVPPAWAWIAELRFGRRLRDQVARVPQTKVVKSS